MKKNVQNTGELNAALIETTCRASGVEQAVETIAVFLKDLSGGCSVTTPETAGNQSGDDPALSVQVGEGNDGYIFTIEPNNLPDTVLDWYQSQFPPLAGLIVERACLIEEAGRAGFRERLKELNISVLQDIGVAVTGTLDIGELTGELIQRLVTVMNVNRAAVILSDIMDRRIVRDRRRRVARAFGCEDDEIAALLDLLNRLSVWDKLKEVPLVVLDSNDHLSEAVNCEKALVAGIVNRGEVLGMIVVGGKEERGNAKPDFSREDRDILISVANFAGAALANSRLFNNVLQMKKFNDDILRSIANGVITTDSGGRIDSFNSSAEKIFGIEADKVRGTDILEFFRGVGADKAAEGLSANLLNGDTFQQTRLSGKNSSGEELVFNLSANSFRDSSSPKDKARVGSIVISIENISEHARIREMLSSYVSPAVAEFALSGRRQLVLGGEKKEVTVLFADIRGFTHLSETREPEEIVELLNSFFDLMIETAFNFGGTVDKIIGDEIMVLFGAPFEFRDDTSRAVRCALTMLDELVGFNARRAEKGLFPINIGVGINRGRVVSGNIGSTRQMSYTVIGDAVNIAKRLVDIAEPGQILISAAVKEKLDEFQPEPVGKPVKVKGRTEAVDVYQIKNVCEPEQSDKMPDVSKYRIFEEKTFPAESGVEVEIANLACEVAEGLGFASEPVEEIRLAVIEAVINAVEHGSGADGKVVVRFGETIETKSFVILIRDFGAGFDSSTTENPDIRKKIHVKGAYKRGWGLKLMREMMNEVRIDSDESGTMVTLVKHRADP